METRSNILLVAIVGGLLFAALLAFTYYLAMGTGSFDAHYEIRFSKSVSGLAKGSPVEMQGVTVGRVQSIALDAQRPGYTLVTVEIDEGLPLHRGVRADISRAFIDGSASIMLLPSLHGPLINPGKDNVGRIEPVGGHTQDPAAEAMDVVGKLDSVVQSLDAEGQARITRGIAGAVEQTADLEQDVSDFLDGFSKKQIRSVARGLSDAGATAGRLQGSMQHAHKDIAKVRHDVGRFGAGAERFANTVADLRPGARSMSDKLKKSDKPVREIRLSVGRVEGKIEPVQGGT